MTVIVASMLYIHFNTMNSSIVCPSYIFFISGKIVTVSSGNTNTYNSPDDYVDKATNSHQVCVTLSPRRSRRNLLTQEKEKQ